MEINEQILKSKYYDQAIEKIKEIVSINSTASEPLPGAPYGKGVLQVLNYAINLANEMGFKTYKDPENKYGYVEYGTGEKIFAILGHLDVVPVGNLQEWKVHPFKPEVIDNILYGRGVLDDKGPTIISLYCLKYLKDNNFVPKHKIRLIFGLTEETTWDSMNTYMKKEGNPDFGFTPDGLFPLTYAEKGIIDIDIKGPGHESVYLNGGEAYNVTCPTCVNKNINVNKFIETAEKLNYRVEKKDKEVIIHGLPAHGSRPEDGINAGLRSLITLYNMNISHPLINFVGEILKEDTALRQYFASYDDESGPLTFNVGLASINEKESKIGCNIRIPVHTGVKTFLSKLEEVLEPYGLKIEIKHYDKPLYMPLDSPLVQNLMSIYKEVTKDETAKPIAIGGGTYARSMPNCVAFGAIFNDKVSTEHQYNECVKLDELWDAMGIYVRAISILSTLDKVC